MQRQSARRSRRGGFTLLEVLLVLAILGVIAAIVVPRLLGQQVEANKDAARASIQGLEKALEFYALRHNAKFPEGDINVALQELMSPTDADGKQQEILLTEEPRDPWEQLLNYEYPTTKTMDGSPAIWSNGPNGTNDEGSDDDITNWLVEEV
jgi:general secretion pathway protein G